MPFTIRHEFEGKFYPEDDPPPILLERIEQAWVEMFDLERMPDPEEKKAK